MNRTQKILGSTILSLLFITMTMFPMCGVKMQRLNPTGDDLGFSEESGDEFEGDLLGDFETMDGEGDLDASLFENGSDMSANGGEASLENSDLMGDEFASESGENSDQGGWGDDGWGDDAWGDDSWGDDSWNESDFSESSNGNNSDFEEFGGMDEYSEDGSSEFIMTDAGSDASSDAWITPELMESLQKEIEDLERIAVAKDRTVDSLRSISESSDFDNANFADNSSRMEQDDYSNALSDSDIPGMDYSQPNQSYTTAADGTRTEVEIAYDEARGLFINRDYQAAIDSFKGMLISQNAGSLMDNCQYWIGEAYFARGEYMKAVVEFEKVNSYPKANKKADAQLMLGIAFMRAGETEQAEKEFSMLVTMHPDNNAAQKAQQYLTKLSRA